MYNTATTWYAASAACYALGGTLAKISTAAQNAELAGRDHAAWLPKESRVSSKDALGKALGKAKEHQLFLGVTWAWLHVPPEKKK